MIFIGPSGSPAAKPTKDSKLHGILHKCTDEEMEELDLIGQSVKKETISAKLYDGALI